MKLGVPSPVVKFLLAQNLFQLFLAKLVFLVTDHRNAGDVVHCREIQPGSAAAVAFRVSESLGGSELKYPNESHMDTLVIVIAKAFVHDVIMEDVELAKVWQQGGICDKAAPLECGCVADFDFAIELGWNIRSRRQGGSAELLVKPGGE